MLRWRRASVSFATTNGLGKASPIRGSALSQRFFGASPGLPASPQGTAPAEGRSVDEKRDNSADDRSDQSRWAEHSLATLEKIAEEPTEQRADEPERRVPNTPMGSLPGTSSRATAPAMRPMISHQMMFMSSPFLVGTQGRYPLEVTT